MTPRLSARFILAMLLGASVSWASADTDALRALHEKILEAHRRSNIEMLLEDESADYVVAGRGEVTRPTLEQRRAFLGPYLKRTAFEEYRDGIEPVVTVSIDGTLGWVVVQVQARGVQAGPDGKKEAIAFTSAWIELYEKRKGRWYRTGNVSNFKE